MEQVVKYQQTAAEVARALALDPSQLRKWIRQYNAEMSRVIPDNPTDAGTARNPHQICALITRLKAK
ncbi:transposase [Brenneria izbisi]|uniref:transposase n=1 Tax=Brenneria izbisi TaxID=2939450 RepID=UPI00384F7A79